MQIKKTFLDEKDIVCDRCMRMARRHEVIEVRSPISTWILHQHKNEKECKK